jgi:hypothetical protein
LRRQERFEMSFRLTRASARLATLLALPAALAACQAFVPLREPPVLEVENPPGSATTRAEVTARFGPPVEVRASDVGEVLVYRRRVALESNPSRYYGGDGNDRLDRYDRILVYLDAEGRVVRTSIEPEFARPGD